VNHSRARDLLSAYLEHDLGDAERAELGAHLVTCTTCVGDLEDLRDAVDLLRRLPDPEPPPFLATRVMARIAAGEARPPVWRRWLQPFRAPLVAAPLAAAAAALAVFHFAPPPSDTEIVVASAEPQARPTPAIVARPVGPMAPAQLVVAPWWSDPRLLARDLRGASHPHSMALAGHFDHPLRAVAYQPR
jgi:anti-sigma factor RsiW